MTVKQRNICIREMDAYTQRDAFVSDMALSSIWGDGPEDEIPPERIEELSRLWGAVHRGVKDIAAEAGLSHRKLAERFWVPYRTMENWCSGNRECPDYVRLMMQECLCLLDVPES